MGYLSSKILIYTFLVEKAVRPHILPVSTVQAVLTSNSGSSEALFNDGVSPSFTFSTALECCCHMPCLSSCNFYGNVRILSNEFLLADARNRRISFLNTEGQCIIGVRIRAMMPLIAYEVVINIYLNILFIIPLRSKFRSSAVVGSSVLHSSSEMYTYRHGSGKMRNLALRTFIGSCATLLSSAVNLTVLMAVGGEPSWLCLMLCNADSTFRTRSHWAK